MIRRLRTAWATLRDLGDPFDIPDWPNDLDQDTPEEDNRD